MSKGLTGIGSGTAAFIAPRERSLTLVERPERAVPPRFQLLAAIHDRVIPELLAAHGAGRRSAAPPAPESMVLPSVRAVGELARIAVCEDLERALAFVDAIAVKGLAPERVLLDLVAPAAVLLETQVNADVRTPLEAALGKSLLHLLVHVLGARCTRIRAYRGLVVLVAAPSERASLGIYVMEECLRGAGWHVQVDPAMQEHELTGLVESDRVETVCVSIGRGDDVADLRRSIVAIRGASRNRGLVVLLAGSLDDTQSAASVGADYCSADPRETVRWLDGHVKTGPVGQRM